MNLQASIRRHLAAVRAMLVFTVILGIAYPLLVTAVGQGLFHDKANGSLLENTQGRVIASKVLCQQYVDAEGNALPQYFQARPSAASDSGNPKDPGCNYAFSGGSNRGTTDPALKQTIAARVDAYAKAYGVDPAKVPQDAVTASGSGLDPGISVDNADIQAPSVAEARGLDLASVRELVQENTDGRSLGFLGQEYVNVVTLNLALDKAAPAAKR
ncbi:MAG: potassium-transporting ATPase subunit KdpC [Catenulispora sp.]|nr:potassium-transporting ATPase subunit KdpC [Catenulispora sp.]